MLSLDIESFDIVSLDILSFDIVSFFIESLDIVSLFIESFAMLSFDMPSFFMSSAAKAGAPARVSDMRAAIEAAIIRCLILLRTSKDGDIDPSVLIRAIKRAGYMSPKKFMRLRGAGAR